MKRETKDNLYKELLNFIENNIKLSIDKGIIYINKSDYICMNVDDNEVKILDSMLRYYGIIINHDDNNIDNFDVTKDISELYNVCILITTFESIKASIKTGIDYETLIAYGYTMFSKININKKTICRENFEHIQTNIKRALKIYIKRINNQKIIRESALENTETLSSYTLSDDVSIINYYREKLLESINELSHVKRTVLIKLFLGNELTNNIIRDLNISERELKQAVIYLKKELKFKLGTKYFDEYMTLIDRTKPRIKNV